MRGRAPDTFIPYGLRALIGLDPAQTETNLDGFIDIPNPDQSEKKYLPVYYLTSEGGLVAGAISAEANDFDAEDHDEEYRAISSKQAGVEPGFEALKKWKSRDLDKVNKQLFNNEGKYRLDNKNKLNLYRLIAIHFFIRNCLNKPAFIGAAVPFPPEEMTQELIRKVDALLTPEIINSNKALQDAIADAVVDNHPKYRKRHFVKADYKANKKGFGDIVTINYSDAKGIYDEKTKKGIWFLKFLNPLFKWIHQWMRRQNIDQANLSAIKESVANDLMHSFGIFTQKLKLVRRTYLSGRPKYLLDGTELMSNDTLDATNSAVPIITQGRRFQDFEGSLSNGYLIQRDPATGKKKHDSQGFLIPDKSVLDLGKYKIFLLLLADRDALGSHGKNKGRVGNIFGAIDPGKALPDDGLMAYKNIRDDFFFEQPKTIRSWFNKGYKNYSAFDNAPLSESMKGVYVLLKLASDSADAFDTRYGASIASFDNDFQRELLAIRPGKDLEIFDAYSAQFENEFTKEGVPYSNFVKKWKKDYLDRRAYILNVFADRLGPNGLTKEQLDLVSNVEKFLSKTSNLSVDKKVKLHHLRVIKRCKASIQMKQNAEGQWVIALPLGSVESLKDCYDAIASPLPKPLFDDVLVYQQDTITRNLSANLVFATADDIKAFLSIFTEEAVARYKNMALQPAPAVTAATDVGLAMSPERKAGFKFTSYEAFLAQQTRSDLPVSVYAASMNPISSSELLQLGESFPITSQVLLPATAASSEIPANPVKSSSLGASTSTQDSRNSTLKKRIVRNFSNGGFS